MSLTALNITQTLERTECMTIIVTSAGETSWVLRSCETSRFRGAGRQRYAAGPALGTPAICLILSVRAVPMKSIGLFICLILSMYSVSCWSRALLGSGTSHVSAFHHESHTPTKPSISFSLCRIF